MGFAFLILLGASIGWLAAVVTQDDAPAAIMRNCAAGIGGALFAGLLLNPLFDQGNLLAGRYSVDALLLSLFGSLVAVALANLLHRRELR